jgi:NtrC-family two-component system response regulator AlgB
MELFPGILGRSPAMQGLFAEMARAAACEVSVHLQGETGTGKEKVARALHERSRRRGRPFVPINAAGLSDDLFEAQLFGHVRGAFTGAVADRPGYVVAAEGGTLFLDEVGELSPRAQAKLLRFLEEREYQRLGDPTVRRANVRLLTATNVDLLREVARGRFREDLLYRLNDLVLSLPPLRTRGEDLLLLAEHFIDEAARSEGRARPRPVPEFWRAVRKYHWPGNVRQLRGEMRRLVVMAGGRAVGPDDLSSEVAAAPVLRGPLRSFLQDAERGHVQRTLDAHGGVRIAAAAALGITRQALHAKMRRLGLTGEPGSSRGRGEAAASRSSSARAALLED